MILEEMELKINQKKLPLEYKILEWKIMLNQELYDEKVIDLKVKSEMEKNLISRMNKIKNEINKV